MPPKGSSGQASTLVARGAGAGSGPTPRQQAAAPARRRSSARLAARPGYFYMEDTPLLQLTPQQVMYFAIGFIALVFFLHIFGKLRGA